MNAVTKDDASLTPPASKTDQGATVRKAQEVLQRSSPSIGQVCLILLTLMAVFYTLYFAAGIILPFILALVLTTVLGPVMLFMNRRLRIPRIIGALLLISALFSAVWVLGYTVAIPAAGWVAKVPQSLPTLVEKMKFLRGPIQMIEHGVKEFDNLVTEDGPRAPVVVKQSGDVSGKILGIGSTVLAGGRAFVGQGFTVLLLLFFFLSSSESLLRRLVEILPHFDDKRRVVSMVSEIEANISLYLMTVSTMNALVGLATGLAVWWLGMPDPLLFGTMAFLLNYVPVIGPLTGVVIFFFAGILTFPTVWLALIPAAIYLAIHILEGEMITPMLLARRFTLNPVIVISSLVFWHWLWGIPGALLSTPVLAVIKIVCDHIEVLAPLGHLIGGTPDRAKEGKS